MKFLFSLLVLINLVGCEWKTTNSEDAKIIAEEKSEQSILNILVEPDSAVLYSIEPSIEDLTANGFHGRKILGQVRLTPDDASKAAQEFKDAADAWKDTMPAKACFNPRVGIRVTKAGKTADFSLCFECNGMRGFVAEKEVFYQVAGSPENLNKMLEAAKLPISPVK